MLLRASGASRNEAYDLGAVMQPGTSTGVPHDRILIELVDAALGRDEKRRAAAREDLVRELGPTALVDTAAIIASFSQAVRTADGAGIPLDEPLEMMTRDLRTELGVTRFASAANTPGA
jgi:hypothetical protein